MSKLTTEFAAKTKRPVLQRQDIGDSLTVMFADIRHGMDKKTAQAFSRLKARATGNQHVADYVAKIEATVGKTAPRPSAGTLKM